MKTRWFLALVMVAFGGVLIHTQAQTIALSDSLAHIFRHRPVFTAKYDTRNTFITGNRASIWGIKAGFVFRKTLTVGVGYNWLWTDIREEIRYPETDRIDMARVRLRYVAPFLDYTFYRKGPWEVTLPVQLGVGTSFVESWRTSEKLKRDWVMLYEPSMSVEYRFLKYFAVGGGYGYRLMLHNNRQLSSRFTSPMYVLRFRILFDELYRLYQQKKANDE